MQRPGAKPESSEPKDIIDRIRKWVNLTFVSRQLVTYASRGAADRQRIPALDSVGKLDGSFLDLSGVATASHHHDADYVNEADYTAADVLNKIKTVDGAGSGLDADLLDGINSTAFPTLAGTQTFTAVNTFSADLIAASGIEVGGGTPTTSARYAPDATFTIANDATQNIGGNTGNLGLMLIINVTEGTAALFMLRGGANATVEYLDPSGTFTAVAGTVNSVNVYWDGISLYRIQNRRGADRTFATHFFSYQL